MFLLIEAMHLTAKCFDERNNLSFRRKLITFYGNKTIINYSCSSLKIHVEHDISNCY